MSTSTVTIPLGDYEYLKEQVDKRQDIIDNYLKEAKPIVVRDYFGFIQRYTVLNADQKLLEANEALEAKIQSQGKQIQELKDKKLPFFGWFRSVKDLLK